MKKKKPDPRQIALDLGFPESPEPGATAGEAGGSTLEPDGHEDQRPAGGRTGSRSQGRGRRRTRTFGDPAARVASDWDSLQDHAPEVLSPSGVLPPDLPRAGQAPDDFPPFDLPPNDPLPVDPSQADPSYADLARTDRAGFGLPSDPDAWSEPADPCPVVSQPSEDEPQPDITLPDGPVDFILPTRIAWAGRRPYSLVAGPMQPGDPVRLQRERDNPHDSHAIRIVNRDGETAGYVYAEEAAWLSLLLDLSPPTRDESVVTRNDGRHVAIDIRLYLPEAWPAFTIVAIFGLRSDRFSRLFNLEGNPYLRPLARLNRRFLANYDYFHMPQTIVEAYAELRQRFEANVRQDNKKASSKEDI